MMMMTGDGASAGETTSWAKGRLVMMMMSRSMRVMMEEVFLKL